MKIEHKFIGKIPDLLGIELDSKAILKRYLKFEISINFWVFALSLF